jgi:amidase
VTPWHDIPSVEQGMRGLEETRRVDFEEWLRANAFDGVVFPAAADVGPSDADVDPASADIAWRNGVWVSNGNLVPRHLGIPTVTIPMGTMDDTGMPVGLTVAGAAYSDTTLLRLARSVEGVRARRVAPARTPALPDEQVFESPRRGADGELSVAIVDVHAGADVTFRVAVIAGAAAELEAFVDGVRVRLDLTEGGATGTFPANGHDLRHSEWRAPYGPLIVAVARSTDGAVAGSLATTVGSPL